MLRSWSLGYFSSDNAPTYSSRRKLSDLILYATYNSTFRENELSCNWILNFCQSNRFSLLLPVKPDERLKKNKEEAGNYWLEVLVGLNHFYEALAAKEDLKHSYDPKELERTNYSYRYHLNQATSKDNFLARYIFLKDFFENKVAEENMEECLADFKATSDEYFPWLSCFGTVAELYIGQLYFSMINILQTKISELQAQAQEYENWKVRDKRLADINMGRIAIAEYIVKSRASLNEFEDKVKANTDLLTFKCVLLNVTEIMAGPTPQAVVARIRVALDAIEKINNPQIKTLNNTLHLWAKDVHLQRMPADNEIKLVSVEKKP